MKEKILDYLKKKPKMSVSTQEMAEDLGLSSGKDFRELVKVLATMEADKLLYFQSDGRVALPDFKQTARLSGVFHAHPYGYGFVTVSPEEPDVFIGRGHTGFAMDGDEVSLELTKPGNSLTGASAEGVIIAIVKRALTELVGTVIDLEGRQAVKGRNKKITLPVLLSKKGLQVQVGDVVRVEITAYPSETQPDAILGIAVETIGHTGDTGIDVLEILESMGIPSAFPPEVLRQAEETAETISSVDLEGREDFREEIIYSVDGADAKDLDDAIHVKRLPSGHFELGVHIADVSYYVPAGSPLDEEALNRGTSTYVTDRVVPMLPERLSNGICSLNPQVDRLTQSCVMEIDKNGFVLNYRIVPSVIRTTYRMTYDDVNLMIAGDVATLGLFPKITESVANAAVLHRILEQMRERRGSLDFNTTEAKILVDEKGLPTAIVKRERGIAERLIESFMLMANETVAAHFAKLGLPFIYRVHEHPKAEKLMTFIDFASALGLHFKGTAQHVEQSDLQAFMRSIRGLPDEQILSTMLLRSMQQARYSADNLGHFGLAAEFYTHFTSPIRRYPDLLVHRLIREYRTNTEAKAEIWQPVIPEIAQQASSRERRAVDAEREVEKMKKAEYLQAYIGDEFDGTVSGVTSFGIFVELENTVEGLIPVNSFHKEYLAFNQRTLTLTSERSGLTFKIGGQVHIKVLRADKITGEIDFEYRPSDFDRFEKPSKSRRGRNKSVASGNNKDGGRQKSGNNQGNHQNTGNKPGGRPNAGKIPGKLGNSKKTQQPYYREAAKKQQRHKGGKAGGPQRGGAGGQKRGR